MIKEKKIKFFFSFFVFLAMFTMEKENFCLYIFHKKYSCFTIC